MPNGDGNKLFSIDGRNIMPNKRPVGFVVLKVPKDRPVPQKLLQMISQVTKCDVLIIPPEYELMTGEIAEKEINAIHEAIHAIVAERRRQEQKK